MRVKAGAYSDKGSCRPHNEDSFLCALQGGGAAGESSAEFSGVIESPLFFLAADGMGGHAAGDIASAFIIEKIKEVSQLKTEFDATSLETLVKNIHAEMLKSGKERGTPNMGSTLTGILLQKDSPCAFFNAGDSRVYRLRCGFFRQLTSDDSLASVVPTAAKNIITNAIGAGIQDVKIASCFSEAVAVAGDIFLMCSDGVHGFISDEELQKMLENTLADKISLKEIAKKIAETAIANNSDDNCTVVVVEIEELEEQVSSETEQIKKERSVEEILAELDAMPVAEDVKRAIREIGNKLQIQKEREERNGGKLKNNGNHFVVMGSVDSERKSITRILCELFMVFGILENDNFIEVNSNDLIGEFIGQSKEKVNKKCDEAMGGMLYVNDAFKLGADNCHVQDAADTLVLRVHEDHNKFICVLAGNKKDMDVFLNYRFLFKPRMQYFFLIDDKTSSEGAGNGR